ncbi:MAG TPA: CBS domain-containing protein [Anaerolineales bacterium]|nr:CBS domain-containing protein [Anaerolineales bacterium]
MNTPIVRNWMTVNPITITPQTTLPNVRRLMHDHHLRLLPVLNNGNLVGVVTWRDIHQAETWDGVDFGGPEQNSLLEHLTAKEFMSYRPLMITPDLTLDQAAYLMVDHKIGGLPVVEFGRLVGVITETDICRSMLQWKIVVSNSEPILDTPLENA